jgi:hypothetical protein
MLRLASALVSAALAMYLASASIAQQPGGAGGAVAPAAVAAAAVQPPEGAKAELSVSSGPKRLPIPAPEEMMMLIRTTLIALNQANFTGNYTVLQDLGTPGLQASNSAASLGNAFTKLRDQRIDLSPVVVLAPELTENPAYTPEGKLRLAGFFPTKPLRISFVMVFQPVARTWRIDGLSVSASQVPDSVEQPAVAAGALPGANAKFKAAAQDAGARNSAQQKSPKTE